MNKSAVMCKWGQLDLPVVSSDVASNGDWDMHVKNVCVNGKKKVNQLHSVLSINLSARRLLLLSVVRPSIEYGSEIWDCNKTQAASLESIV